MSRNAMLTLLTVLFLAGTAVVFRSLYARHGRPPSPPPGHSQVWRCRADGCETNMTPGQIAGLLREGRHRQDPQAPWITLFPCPRCGRMELEVITRTPEGEFDQRGPLDEKP